jgi:hypothetical protein
MQLYANIKQMDGKVDRFAEALFFQARRCLLQ